MLNILLLHGPNLNFLGERETKIYGALTLPQINRKIRAFAKANGITVKIFQSNCEGRLIDLIYRHRRWASGIVINPAAYTHYSYALRDALKASNLPAVEAHLSDVKKREPFRRISVTRPACVGQISGLGWQSYIRALDFLKKRLS